MPDPSLIIREFVELPRAVFASDLTWDSLAHSAAQHYVFAPIRKELQTLARAHRESEAQFQQKCSELIAHHFEKVRDDPSFQSACALWNATLLRLKPNADAVLKQAGGSQGEYSLPDVTRKQLEAIGYLVSCFLFLLAGQTEAINVNQVLEALASLWAKRPGPKVEPDRRLKGKVLAGYAAAIAEGKEPTTGEIAARVFSWYSDPNTRASFRDGARRDVRNVLRPLRLTKRARR